jgi:peptidoglycan/xylan/chitin deacetylase (PgdA/CDA1 family)
MDRVRAGPDSTKMFARLPSSRSTHPRRPAALLVFVLALGGLLSSAASAGGLNPKPGPGDPLAPAAAATLAGPSPLTSSPPSAGILPAACQRGPASPPAIAASLPPLDPGASRRWIRLPILMYHYIEPPAPGLSVVERGLTVRPQDFAAQMRYLHDRGYTTVSLYDLVEALRSGRALPARAVVLTFDGGHRSLLQYAVPILQPYGFTGTIFVITKGMDEGQALYLTWPQATNLYNQGWKIEPHTRTHLLLAGRGLAVQWAELCGSLLDVAEHIGATPRFIAYPSGGYDALTLQLVARLGFWGGLTTRIDRWHGLWSEYTLSRVRVSGTESLQAFTNSVDGDLLLSNAPK